jgi:predicted dehydrogenase
MNKLKGAVIGFGKMGMLHFAIANSHPDVEITTVCDNSDFILKMFNKLTGLKTYNNHKKLLNDLKLDFAIVSTPVKYHFEIINDLMNAGVSVFTEKPFTIKYSESEILSKAVKTNQQIKNQVGYVYRYHPIFRKAKEFIDQALIGTVTDFSFEFYGAVVLRELKDNWRGKKDIGGGCLMEFSTHTIDLINYLFGKPKNILSATLKRIYSKEVDDYVHAVIEYDNGITGWLNSSWSDESVRLPSNKIIINGKDGKIIATDHTLSMFLKTDKRGFNKGWTKIFITDLARPVRIFVGMDIFTLQMDDFIHSVKINKQCNNDFGSAHITSWILNEISTKSGFYND